MHPKGMDDSLKEKSLFITDILTMFSPIHETEPAGKLHDGSVDKFASVLGTSEVI
jgi:hypothetical protein